MIDSANISPCVEFIKQTLGTGLTGVEIGIWSGGNAEIILQYIEPKKYYLIDPYKKEIKDYYKSSLTQASFDKAYKSMFTNFSGLPNIVIMKMTSEEAAPKIENNLDFVYIDGAHTYKGVKLDLNLWWPKVRNGGILSGDDYNIEGVSKAVDEFALKHGLELKISTKLKSHPIEFWIIK